ncbi:MAG: hypothetical protein M1326_04800 [Cyanobacteria bacterium]|nr:hypothetical protein [Cyanobacteriota bacterium]
MSERPTTSFKIERQLVNWVNTVRPWSIACERNINENTLNGFLAFLTSLKGSSFTESRFEKWKADKISSLLVTRQIGEEAGKLIKNTHQDIIVKLQSYYIDNTCLNESLHHLLTFSEKEAQSSLILLIDPACYINGIKHFREVPIFIGSSNFVRTELIQRISYSHSNSIDIKSIHL